MADDFTARIFTIVNAAGETLTWDNVVDVNAKPLTWNGPRVYKLDQSSAIFLSSLDEARQYVGNDIIRKLAGDAALIFQSDNRT